MTGERQTGPDPMTTETAEMFLRRAERAEAEVERVRADFAAYVDVARLKATQFGERVRDAQAERDAYKVAASSEGDRATGFGRRVLNHGGMSSDQRSTTAIPRPRIAQPRLGDLVVRGVGCAWEQGADG